MQLAEEKIAEALLATFSSALTLLLSNWVDYRVASARQVEDAAVRRKENVMDFYNQMSSPEFVAARRQSKQVFKHSLAQNDMAFMAFHWALDAPERASISSLMLLFRKLDLGLNHEYFDLDAVVACFGDQIITWHDGCGDGALATLDWPSWHALQALYVEVRCHAAQDKLTRWDGEARTLKADVRLHPPLPLLHLAPSAA